MKLPITNKDFDYFTYATTHDIGQVYISRFSIDEKNIILYDDYNFPFKFIEDDYYNDLCEKYEKKKYTLEQLFEDFLE